MKTIIVTGCSGFIGSKVVKFYLQKGCKVIGIDSITSKKNHDYEFYRIDMATEDSCQLYKKINPDAIVHCAGSASVGISVEYPEIDFDKNVKVLYKLLFAIKKANINPKFIFLSSAAVYGNPKKLPIKENDSLNPISPYGLNKKICEDICKYFISNENLDIKILRIFSAYGEGIKKQILWDIYKKLEYAKCLELYGTGEETRDFIHIDDILHAMDLILSSNSREIIFNIANGVETKIKDLSKSFVKELGKNSCDITFNNLVKDGDPLNWRADISRLRDIGYKTNVNIYEGIKQYVNWLRSIDND